MTPAASPLTVGGALVLLLVLLAPAVAPARPASAPHRGRPVVRRVVRVREVWRIADCADGARIRARVSVSVCRRHGGLIGWED